MYYEGRRGHKAELQASLSSEATCSYRRAMQATQSLVEERPGNGRLYKLLNYFKYKTRVQATITYQLMVSAATLTNMRTREHDIDVL